MPFSVVRTMASRLTESTTSGVVVVDVSADLDMAIAYWNIVLHDKFKFLDLWSRYLVVSMCSVIGVTLCIVLLSGIDSLSVVFCRCTKVVHLEYCSPLDLFDLIVR